MKIFNRFSPKHKGLSVTLLASLIAGGLGTGCAGAPDPRMIPQPPAASESWSVLEDLRSDADLGPNSVVKHSDGEDIASWWRQLGDPVLDRLVDAALDDNLTLQTAAARVSEARARRGLLKADLGPTISAGFNAGAREPLGDGFSSDQFSASFETAWEADLFGAKRLSLAAGEADLAAGIEDLHAVRVSLVAEVVVAYTELRVAEVRLSVVDESLGSREETYSLTNFREQAGLTTQLEVNQALSNLEQTRAGRAPLEQSRIYAELRLALLTGRTLDDLAPLLASDAPGDLPEPPDTVTVGLPAEALSRRPDVRAAAHRLDAALAQLGVAEAARYPTLRLTGSLDGQSSDLGDLFDADSFVANLLAGLTAPIFQSGRIQQNIGVEQAQLEQSSLAYRDQVLQALSEVESALASWHLIHRQLNALDEAVDAARKAAELAEQRYESGLVDLLVVLDSQRTLLSLKEQLVSAQGERVITFSNLYRALGGWDADAPGVDPAVASATTGASDV